MAEIDTHAPGTFCWHELVPGNPAGARTFYSDLLGWDVHEIPTDEGVAYTVFRVRGRDVAGMIPRSSEDGRDVSPRWRSYVSVTSADDGADEARDLGGKALADPFDVAGIGRMAMIQDSTGGTFGLWQPAPYVGVGRIGEPGSACWSELWTPDLGRGVTFYTRLFGWGSGTREYDGGPYTFFTFGDDPIAGAMEIPESDQAAQPGWLVYWGVSDCDDRSRAAESAGARIRIEPTTIAGIGRFAVLVDPQGASFGLVQQVNWDWD